jgi:hypothetical protein
MWAEKFASPRLIERARKAAAALTTGAAE